MATTRQTATAKPKKASAGRTRPAKAKSSKPARATATTASPAKTSKHAGPKSAHAQAGVSARFDGFPDREGKFFKQLAKNQKKEWFDAHKAEFEEGWAGPMLALMTELRERLDASYPDVELAPPKRFRIYRDVRFSKDKSPYKTHVAGMIGVESGKNLMAGPAALYFHVGEADFAGGSGPFAGAGVWMTDPPALAKLRAAIVDDASGVELARLLQALEKKGFKKDAHGVLAKVPRGFDPAHPRAELLKLKGLTVSFPRAPEALLTTRKLVDHLADQGKAVAPLVRWLTFAIQ